jgi:transposase
MEQARDQQKLRRWCVRRLLEDWTLRRVSDHARIPKSTVHDWWTRFQWKGWEGLLDMSRRPRTIHRLSEATVQRVIQVRREQGWCHEAIAAYLNQRENLKVSCGSVYTILKRNGLITKPYKPRRRRVYISDSQESILTVYGRPISNTTMTDTSSPFWTTAQDMFQQPP